MEKKDEIQELLLSIWNKGFSAGDGRDEAFDVDAEYARLVKIINLTDYFPSDASAWREAMPAARRICGSSH